ncbi:MAG: universal stress protein [Chloroflexota bacterium]|nr:MAG: universal stress protein [Chloroflexota bacterium]
MFNKVLVPLDGSELAERALDPALAIIRALNAELLLLSVTRYQHVLPPPAAGYGLTATDQIVDLGRDEANNYLSSLRHEARCGDCRIQTMVVEGDAAGSIVDTAADEEVDLIVMTTHGYSGFTRWMLGSITERVLRGASCPVLVVRQAIPLCKILITLDGSSLAEDALAPGLELARVLGCRVTLLRADQGEDLSSVEQGLLQMAGAGPCQELIEGAEDRLSYYLECLARQHRSPELSIETAIVQARPAEAILTYVESEEIDLIVMATHGRTGLRRWVYGSVTEKVLRQAGCAMLIVRPPASQVRDSDR